MNKIIDLHFNMRSIIFSILMFCLLTIGTSCLQKDYDYEGEPLNPNINMTAWEFMQSRPDIFSRMIEAVEYAEMRDFYTQTDRKYTYLFLNNTAMENFLAKYGAGDFIGVDVEKVRKLLLYHIIVGEYHAYNKKLPIEPIYVKTLLEGEDGLLTIMVEKSAQATAVFQDQIVNGNVIINQSNSNYASQRINSVTTNILANNGPIHVYRNYAFFKRNASYVTAY